MSVLKLKMAELFRSNGSRNNATSAQERKQFTWGFIVSECKRLRASCLVKFVPWMTWFLRLSTIHNMYTQNWRNSVILKSSYCDNLCSLLTDAFTLIVVVEVTLVSSHFSSRVCQFIQSDKNFICNDGNDNDDDGDDQIFFQAMIMLKLYIN